jgi:short-subunit dehydrogenase
MNKFCVVTGASTGIGRVVAVALGREREFICLVARRKEKLEETKKLVEKAGGQAKIFSIDLANITSTKNLISQIKKITSKVDLIVNIAGVWHSQNEVFANTDFEKFSQETVLQTLNVGIVAPMVLVHGLLPLMPQGSQIINLSGTFENGAKGWLPYYVSKRAIEDFTVGLAQDLREKGVLVNCVSPSDVATEEYIRYFPEFAEEALAPEEVVEFIAKLAIKNKTDSGKVFVLKKGKTPLAKFHA